VLLTVDLDRLGVGRGDRLLDVGCGEGRHCFGALERGARVVGLDLDRDSLRKGHGPLRARARELGGVGAMLRGDAFHLPFADARFDRAICSEVMEHVHDFPAAARELARVVRPGGTVAVTVPTATSEALYLRLGDDYFESPGGHIRIFRPRDLAAALRGAGLAPSGIGFAHGFHTPYWALRSIVGLPRSDANPLVQAYRMFLIKATTSRLLDRFEKRVLNYLCPNSLVLYAQRTAEPAARAA
jgi:SAM-dependent methyltransferase